MINKIVTLRVDDFVEGYIRDGIKEDLRVLRLDVEINDDTEFDVEIKASTIE